MTDWSSGLEVDPAVPVSPGESPNGAALPEGQEDSGSVPPPDAPAPSPDGEIEAEHPERGEEPIPPELGSGAPQEDRHSAPGTEPGGESGEGERISGADPGAIAGAEVGSEPEEAPAPTEPAPARPEAGFVPAGVSGDSARHANGALDPPATDDHARHDHAPDFASAPTDHAPPVAAAPPVALPESIPAEPTPPPAEAAPAPAVDGAPEPPAPVRPLPRAVAVANQKGGVGKTTTAVNLGAGLAELGYRVLVVDLDPQGNATTGLGINPRNLTGSVYDVLMSDAPLEDCIEPTAVRNLFVVPATIDLAGAEIELVPTFSRELKLRRAIDSLGPQFDFSLIDCPPSLGLLTVNGLAAADEVLVPIQCEYYALEGLGQLIKNIQLVQSNLNPRLELSTIVLTMYDARTRLSDQVASDVREHFGPKVCRTIVPRTVRLSEAPSFGQPINVFDPTSRGATAYRELAKEVSGGAPRRAG